MELTPQLCHHCGQPFKPHVLTLSTENCIEMQHLVSTVNSVLSTEEVSSKSKFTTLRKAKLFSRAHVTSDASQPTVTAQCVVLT